MACIHVVALRIAPDGCHSSLLPTTPATYYCYDYYYNYYYSNYYSYYYSYYYYYSYFYYYLLLLTTITTTYYYYVTQPARTTDYSVGV